MNKDYKIINGDCIEVMAGMDPESVGYSIFSPPFASLYVYSDDPRDLGNVIDHTEFFDGFRYVVQGLERVMMPGRDVSIHCMDLPKSKERDDVIGLYDFPGDITRAMETGGFVKHSEVCIWKDPVTAMQRTKAIGLLHKQLKKDSCMSRQGIPDKLLTFRKPGENPNPVSHMADEFPVSRWQEWASPVWMNINPSNTLQRKSARDFEDERHICPLQLEVIERGIALWSNPGDLILSPFAGIGSEGVVAIAMGRRFIGIELKPIYAKQAEANLRNAGLQQELPAEVPETEALEA